MNTPVYLLCNALSMYSKYKSMQIFFDRTDSKDTAKRKFEIFSFFMYFAVNSLLFLILHNDFLNLVNSLLIFFLLTFNYKSSVLKKIAATVIVYAISFSLEILAYYTILFVVAEADKQFLLSTMISKIAFYFVVVILSNLKNIKTNPKISGIYIAVITSSSIFNIYISIVLTLHIVETDMVLVVIAISALLIMNFFVIYIYDVIYNNYEKEMENKLLEQQNNFYLRELEMIQQSQDNVRLLKHDIKNHFISMKAIYDDGDKMKDYINEFLKLSEVEGDYAKSGNIIIDSILNYKLYEAQKKGIEVDLALKVPIQLNIRNFDLTVILGNLLDNAIEASSKCKDSRKIKVDIYFDKNNFYVNIINTFDGKLNIENKKYRTTNKNKAAHGFGLLSVERALENYHGEMYMSVVEDSLFSVKVLLYDIT